MRSDIRTQLQSFSEEDVQGIGAEEGSPAELFAKENSLFRRMTQLQNASAGWSI